MCTIVVVREWRKLFETVWKFKFSNFLKNDKFDGYSKLEMEKSTNRHRISELQLSNFSSKYRHIYFFIVQKQYKKCIKFTNWNAILESLLTNFFFESIDKFIYNHTKITWRIDNIHEPEASTKLLLTIFFWIFWACIEKILTTQK